MIPVSLAPARVPARVASLRCYYYVGRFLDSPGPLGRSPRGVVSPLRARPRRAAIHSFSGCAGGATSGLPTESQGRRAAGARAPPGTAVIAATCGPHPPFRHHASRFAAEPAAIRRRQPPRARLPARLHPTDRPAESQPRTLAHRHVAVRRVVLARVVALAVSPCCFCAPLALGSEPQLLFSPFPQCQTR